MDIHHQDTASPNLTREVKKSKSGQAKHAKPKHGTNNACRLPQRCSARLHAALVDDKVIRYTHEDLEIEESNIANKLILSPSAQSAGTSEAMY